jgi:hypothetical protein
MKCYSCNKQKNELLPKKSDLLNGVDLFMCTTCLESKFEPRWIVVLAGRQNGPDFVREYIIKRKYIGEEILANELLV